MRHDRYSQRLYYRHDQPAPYNAGLGRTDRSAKTVPTDWDGRAGFGDHGFPAHTKDISAHLYIRLWSSDDNLTHIVVGLRRGFAHAAPTNSRLIWTNSGCSY